MSYHFSGTATILFGSLLTLVGSSCTPKSDPAPPPIELTRKYCNDPLAINYNDSFPGIPDNSRCLYPYDPFLGTWEMIDSIFREDETFLYSDTKNIQFEILPSENKNQLQLYNWCDHGPIKLKAQKGSIANIMNTLTYPDSAQIACGGDSLMGQFKLVLMHDDSMNIEIIRRSTAGTVNIHRATAKKK